jgi:hypothetical protein
MESWRTLSRRLGAMPMLLSRYILLLPQSFRSMLTGRCPACLKGMSLSREAFVGILAGIKWR